jgi:hypothetical protein
MKRDWDLVREILEKVEDGSLQTYLSKENFIKSRRKTPAFRHGDISRVLSSCIRHLRVV